MILVTGGAGLMDSQIVDMPAQYGHDVGVLELMPTVALLE